VQQLLAPSTGAAKRKTPPATQRLRDALVGLARAAGGSDDEEGSDEEED